MVCLNPHLAVAAALAGTAAAHNQYTARALAYGANSTSALSNAATSLTLLYQNNLNASDDKNHVGAILLDAMPQGSAASACQALSESLLPASTIQAHEQDFAFQLAYIQFVGRAPPDQQYLISGGVVSHRGNASGVTFQSSANGAAQLPVLCTQSSSNGSANALATTSNEIAVSSNGNTFVGFRNQKSFRFQGIPFANQPQRFTYSTVYTPKGQRINATKYGSECAQAGNAGSENCLFINIQTPYIPAANSTKDLRPVLFWIYGGGFTGGSGSDPLTDGGNLASREDLVVVEVNYRLSTLGFLAIPGSNITGNYGIGDQITGLQWVIENIASFGGDPNMITINGESAGAGSVRTLLGSPPAIGKFQGAICMSNLGGGVDLGLSGDYGTTYSSYYNLSESYAMAGQQIFAEAGCNQTSLGAQILCLETVDANTLADLKTVAKYVVQDGTIVNTEELEVSGASGSVAHVPVIFGNVANDGASFSTYPMNPVANETAGIQASLGINASYAQAIIDSGLFPYYDTGNVTLDSFNVSQRVATDKTFRCVDQATVYAGATSGVFPRAYYYQMDRTIAGYDPNNLGGPPVAPGYPLGDPNLPYFRLHGADLPWAFGNLAAPRDANDLYSIQLVTGYFAEFVKSGQPNPSEAYLTVRGYTTTLAAVEATGPWEPIGSDQGPIRLLDYPPTETIFQDLPQCAFLNYSISYYLEGGM